MFVFNCSWAIFLISLRLLAQFCVCVHILVLCVCRAQAAFLARQLCVLDGGPYHLCVVQLGTANYSLLNNYTCAMANANVCTTGRSQCVLTQQLHMCHGKRVYNWAQPMTPHSTSLAHMCHGNYTCAHVPWQKTRLVFHLGARLLCLYVASLLCLCGAASLAWALPFCTSACTGLALPYHIIIGTGLAYTFCTSACTGLAYSFCT